jgi:hypothetical protein
MIIQTYYIGTGRKNAFYTLRCSRDGDMGQLGLYAPDFFVCTLAATEDKAVEKAADYVDRMRGRIGETDDFKIVFDDVPHHENTKRRGRLSVTDSIHMDMIDAGTFPKGRYRDQSINSAPDHYILYFADRVKEYTDPVMLAIATACMGIALERDLITKREARRAEIAAVDSLSSHIGMIGERRDFEGVVEVAFEKIYPDTTTMWINKVRCGQDIVMYFGSKALGEVGATIKFRATVKSHGVYLGAKQTIVSHPA